MEHHQKASTITLRFLQGAARVGCSLQRSEPGAEDDSKVGTGSVLVEKEHSTAGCRTQKTRGILIGDTTQGQPRVQTMRQAHRDEISPRSSREVNKSEQVRISKVSGQLQAQLRSSRGKDRGQAASITATPR